MHHPPHSARTRASHDSYLLGHLHGRATTTAATALRGGCPGSSEGGFRISGSPVLRHQGVETGKQVLRQVLRHVTVVTSCNGLNRSL